MIVQLVSTPDLSETQDTLLPCPPHPEEQKSVSLVGAMSCEKFPSILNTSTSSISMSAMLCG